MRKQATPDTLIDDLQGVVHDAEALLKATAGQAGEKIQEARARTEESLRRAKARLSDVDGEALKRARASLARRTSTCEQILGGHRHCRRHRVVAWIVDESSR
jgi:ElaB/YqjD/DUF883 family membrane-anchored ribosome-binding protein